MKTFIQFLTESKISDLRKENESKMSPEELQKLKAAQDVIHQYMTGISDRINSAYHNDPNVEGAFGRVYDRTQEDLSTIQNQVKDLGVSPTLDAEAKKASNIPVVGGILSDVIGNEFTKRAMTNLALRNPKANFVDPIATEDKAFLDTLKKMENDPNVTPLQLAMALKASQRPKMHPAWTVSPKPTQSTNQ
jgi:hypothetical protein